MLQAVRIAVYGDFNIRNAVWEFCCTGVTKCGGHGMGCCNVWELRYLGIAMCESPFRGLWFVRFAVGEGCYLWELWCVRV